MASKIDIRLSKVQVDTILQALEYELDTVLDGEDMPHFMRRIGPPVLIKRLKDIIATLKFVKETT